MRFGSVLAAFALAASVLASTALAAELSKAERKTFEADVQAAYPGTIWALKDLPVNTGFTMMAAWISPIAELTPSGFSIQVGAMGQATFGSASSVWYGVRPNDTLHYKEIEFDDEFLVIAFVGEGTSKGRDTKVKISGATTFAQVKPVMDQLLTATSPVDASWPEDIRQGIANRTLVNGMSKRQAYLVVGEPTEASTSEEGGTKVETWKTRQTCGMRIGYAASVETTGYPQEIRFVDGKLTGIATTTGGGVNLDD